MLGGFPLVSVLVVDDGWSPLMLGGRCPRSGPLGLNASISSGDDTAADGFGELLWNGLVVAT